MLKETRILHYGALAAALIALVVAVACTPKKGEEEPALLSLDEAAQIMLSEVVKPDELEREIIVFAWPDPLQPGDQVQPYRAPDFESPGEVRTIESNTWFFWAEDAPGARFVHPTRFIFVDQISGQISVSDEEWWPVLNEEGLWVEEGQYWDESNWAYSNVDWRPSSGAQARTPGVLASPLMMQSAHHGNPGSAIVINGWSEGQPGKENSRADAQGMHKSLRDAGFESSLYGSTGDTIQDISDWFIEQGKELKVGETVVVYISSHGGERNQNGILLVGGDVISEEILVDLLKLFDPGVNVVVIIDACKSGSFIDGVSEIADVTITATSLHDKAYSDFDPKDNPYYHEDDPNPEDTGSEFTSGFVLDWNELLSDFSSKKRVIERAEREGENFWEALAAEAWVTAVGKDAAFQNGLSFPQIMHGGLKALGDDGEELQPCPYDALTALCYHEILPGIHWSNRPIYTLNDSYPLMEHIGVPGEQVDDFFQGVPPMMTDIWLFGNDGLGDGHDVASGEPTEGQSLSDMGFFLGGFINEDLVFSWQFPNIDPAVGLEDSLFEINQPLGGAIAWWHPDYPVRQEPDPNNWLSGVPKNEEAWYYFDPSTQQLTAGYSVYDGEQWVDEDVRVEASYIGNTISLLVPGEVYLPGAPFHISSTDSFIFDVIGLRNYEPGIPLPRREDQPTQIDANGLDPSEWPVSLQESFDSNERGWPLGESDSSFVAESRDVTDGVYRWGSTAHKGSLSRAHPSMFSASDFYLTVDAQKVGGADDSVYGIVYRVVGDDNFYYFAVSDYQTYSVYLRYGGEWTILKDWTSSTAIRPGEVNRLGVIAEGSRFRFLINGQEVTEIEDGTLARGTVGLASELYNAGDDSTLEFDNLELRESRHPFMPVIGRSDDFNSLWLSISDTRDGTTFYEVGFDDTGVDLSQFQITWDLSLPDGDDCATDPASSFVSGSTDASWAHPDCDHAPEELIKVTLAKNGQSITLIGPAVGPATVRP